MKKSRFSDEQIIGMIKEQESGIATAEVCRKHGISTASFYKYKSKFGGMDVSDARIAKVVTPAEKRKAVGHLCDEHGVSQRRACDVLDVDRSSVRYIGTRPDDAELRKAMKAAGAQKRRSQARPGHAPTYGGA